MRNDLVVSGKKVLVFTAALLLVTLSAVTVLAAGPLRTHSFVVDATSNWDKITPNKKVAFFEDYLLTLYFETADSDYIAVTWCQDEVSPEAPAGMVPLVKPFFFTTGDALNNFSVRIEMNYRPLLPLENIIENTLGLYRYDEDEGQWNRCGFDKTDHGIDLEEKFIWAELTGFSRFGVFGQAVEAPPLKPERPAMETKPGAKLEKPLPRTVGKIPLLLPAALFILTGFLLLRRQFARSR